MRLQMTAIALELAWLLAARPLYRRLGLLLRRLEHAVGKFGIFQGKVELV